MKFTGLMLAITLAKCIVSTSALIDRDCIGRFIGRKPLVDFNETVPEGDASSSSDDSVISPPSTVSASDASGNTARSHPGRLGLVVFAVCTVFGISYAGLAGKKKAASNEPTLVDLGSVIDLSASSSEGDTMVRVGVQQGVSTPFRQEYKPQRTNGRQAKALDGSGPAVATS